MTLIPATPWRDQAPKTEHDQKGPAMSAAATLTYPASRPDHSPDGQVVLPGDASHDDARPPFRACSQEASALALICKWVHADDGALVMEWIKAEDMHVRRGPGGQQPPSAAGLAVRDARVLTPRRPLSLSGMTGARAKGR